MFLVLQSVLAEMDVGRQLSVIVKIAQERVRKSIKEIAETHIMLHRLIDLGVVNSVSLRGRLQKCTSDYP